MLVDLSEYCQFLLVACSKKPGPPERTFGFTVVSVTDHASIVGSSEMSFCEWAIDASMSQLRLRIPS